MKRYSVIILSILIFKSYGQSVDVQAQDNLMQLGLVSNRTSDPIAMTNPDLNFEVKGSRYLNDEFSSGFVTLSRRPDTVRNILLRYNVLEDALEMSAESRITVLAPRPINTFQVEIDGLSATFKNAEHMSQDELDGYVRAVYLGEKIEIYLKYSCDREVKDSREAYGSTKDFVIYDQEIQTFFSVDGTFKEIENKKKLIELFGEREEFKKIKKSDLVDLDKLMTLGKNLDN